MIDVLGPARLRINTLHDEFMQVTEQLSKPVQFIQRFNENSINRQISDVFQEAANLLSTVSLTLQPETKYIQSPNPQINKYKLEIEKLRTELDRKTRLFDQSIAVARQMYSDKLSSLAEEYKQKLIEQKENSKLQEEELQAELDAAKEDFNVKLKEETAQHVQTAKMLDLQMNKIKSEFEITQQTLNTSLNASKLRLQMLQKQEEMLKETNSHVIDAIHDKYKQQIDSLTEQNKKTIQQMTEEYNNLLKQKEENSEQFEEELKRLNYALEHIDETLDNTIDEGKKKIQQIYDKKIKKLENKHQRNMDDIMHQIEMDNVQSTAQIQLLKNNIDQTRKQLDEGDRRFKEEYDTIIKRTELITNEKNNEMRLVAKMHIKTLEQLQQQADLDMEQEKHKAKKTKTVLEAKINQTLRESEALRVKLESEITALTRARDKFEEEMKNNKNNNNNSSQITKKRKTGQINSQIVEQRMVTPPQTPPPSKQPRFSGRAITPKLARYKTPGTVSIPPENLSDDAAIAAELVFRTRKFFEAWKHENFFATFAIESQQRISQAELDILKLQTKKSDEEIKELEDERDSLQRQIAEAEQKIDMIQTQDDDSWDDKQNELNALIASQQTMVMKLREEIQSRKQEGTISKNSFDIIRKENEQQINEAKAEFNKVKENIDARISQLRRKHEEEVKNVQTKSKEIISECEKQLNAIEKEIHKLTDGYKEKSDADHNLWLSIRKEMADSSNKVGRILQSRGQSSRSVSVASPKPRLPPLK